MSASATARSAPSSGGIPVVVRQLEAADGLDAVVVRTERLAVRLAEHRVAGPALRGDWMGHALHPLLTDFPLGCWLSAGFLDLLGGRRSRPAAQRLVGIGVVMSLPTAMAGMAELGSVHERPTQRVAFVHGLGNVAVASLYLSWTARRHGRYLRGVALAIAGGSLAWVTGYLGGHLSLVQGVGRGERGPDDGAEPTPAGAESTGSAGSAARRPSESAEASPSASPTQAPISVEEERRRLLADAGLAHQDPEDALKLVEELSTFEPLADAYRHVDRHLASGDTVQDARAALDETPPPGG